MVSPQNESNNSEVKNPIVIDRNGNTILDPAQYAFENIFYLKRKKKKSLFKIPDWTTPLVILATAVLFVFGIFFLWAFLLIALFMLVVWSLSRIFRSSH